MKSVSYRFKAANTIETAPQRVQRKQIAAEEPVTARIRRPQVEATEVQHAEIENSLADHAGPRAAADVPGTHRVGALAEG